MPEKETDRLEIMRHSASHIMAEAVQALFPGAKFGIGPSIEEGFYYDFDLPRPLTPEDLPRIEARMRESIAADLPFLREEVSKEEARRVFSDQPYKLELLEDIPEERVTLYHHGEFTDLCRGPHLPSTRGVKVFKLLSIAGAYWRGEEGRPMLQRLYGIAFETQAELEQHLYKLEEASQRDHRRLGRELELFSLQEDIGPGLVLWHPKGALIRHLIESFWKEEHLKRGYEIVYSPHIARLGLWQVSGHWEMYRQYLYSPMDIEGQPYILKPMNCPFHIMMFKSRRRSYRELPLRWAELGTVYRYERSGVLHGLARVRGFTQDDAHLFCRPDQLQGEVEGVLELARFMLSSFGFREYEIMLSTRPEKFVGSLEIWEEATATLKRALEAKGLAYQIDPGEGVFYGPKVDIKLKDALGRGWQGPTIQVDFNLPQRFEVTFTGEDGQEHQAVMVHRTVLGSMERFLACLVEHYKGAFPLWLSPVQALVIPIADRHHPYAFQVEAQLKEAGLRAQVDASPERMNQKIRRAQLEKVPYMLVVGDREQGAGSVSLRLRSGEDQGGVPLTDFIALAREAIARRE